MKAIERRPPLETYQYGELLAFVESYMRPAQTHNVTELLLRTKLVKHRLLHHGTKDAESDTKVVIVQISDVGELLDRRVGFGGVADGRASEVLACESRRRRSVSLTSSTQTSEKESRTLGHDQSSVRAQFLRCERSGVEGRLDHLAQRDGLVLEHVAVNEHLDVKTFEQ